MIENKLKVKRPVLRYYGGKWLTAPWIISHFPEHRVYVEPFAGAGSVLLRKLRSYAEILNDIDGDVVNLFEVLRDRGPELLEKVKLTPFARDEHSRAYIPARDPVERARRVLVRSFLGFGSDSIWRKSGFRADSNRSGTTPAIDWKNFPSIIPAIINRLMGVIIENRDAFEIICKHDRWDTLIYVDPPYLHSSRSGGERYRHELSNEQHEGLAYILNKSKSKVVVSAYPSPLYNRLYSGWYTDEKRVLAQCVADSSKSGRTEVLFMNFKPKEMKLF